MANEIVIVPWSSQPQVQTGEPMFFETQQLVNGKYENRIMFAVAEEIERITGTPVFSPVATVDSFTVLAPTVLRSLLMPVVSIPSNGTLTSQDVVFDEPYDDLNAAYGDIELNVGFFVNYPNLIYANVLALELTVKSCYSVNSSAKTSNGYTYMDGKLLVSFLLVSNELYTLSVYNANLESIKDVELVPSEDLSYLVVPPNYYIPHEITETIDLDFDVKVIDIQNDVFNYVDLIDVNIDFRSEIFFNQELFEVGKQYKLVGEHTLNGCLLTASAKDKLILDFSTLIQDDPELRIFNTYLVGVDTTVEGDFDVEVFGIETELLKSELKFYKQ